MKKLMLTLLLGIPMLFAATSCDDDKDLPQVDISVNVTGAVTDNGVVYVVKGDTLSINGIQVTNLDKGQAASITAPVTFYWDGLWMAGGQTWVFPTLLSTWDIPVGDHILMLEMGVIANDKSPAFAVVTIPVVVVASADDLPKGTDPDTGGVWRDVVGTQSGLPAQK